MAESDNSPLSPDEVERAIAMLRAGQVCQNYFYSWRYLKEESRFFLGIWVSKDNEWAASYITETELRKYMAEHAGTFREMLAKAM